jgi:hypothetical protein
VYVVDTNTSYILSNLEFYFVVVETSLIVDIHSYTLNSFHLLNLIENYFDYFHLFL